MNVGFYMHVCSAILRTKKYYIKTGGNETEKDRGLFGFR